MVIAEKAKRIQKCFDMVQVHHYSNKKKNGNRRHKVIYKTKDENKKNFLQFCKEMKKIAGIKECEVPFIFYQTTLCCISFACFAWEE